VWGLHSLALSVGSTIGDYQIVSLIGRGGMGRVFKVRNILSDRIEAMKSHLSYADEAPELAERFIREIKVLAKLEHPNITTFRTAFRVGNELMLIMEHVEGSSLDRRLKAGRIETWRAVHYMCQVLSALDHAHRAGVLHRDVKPSNILLGSGDSVKLTDFGIASLAGDTALTITGNTMGSLHYMSPEQMKAEMLDARSDLYSAGVTLYEMVTGQIPVQGDSFYAILKAHLEQKPTPPIRLVPDVPPELSDLIVKSLEKDPKARFQSAEEFRTALETISSVKCPTDFAVTAISYETDSSRPRTPSGETKSWDPEMLEAAKKNLAIYIGPMARVIVSRATGQAKSIQELYQLLAAEIPSLQDRDKFLRTMPL